MSQTYRHCATTAQQQIRAFIDPLWPSLLVCNWLDLSVWIDGIEAFFCCRLYFCFSDCQWGTAFINLLLTSLMACNWFILFVQINGINLPSVADFFFTFSLFWPPAAPMTCNGWQNVWTLFRYHLWYVNTLFGQFKLSLMTCVIVAGVFSLFQQHPLQVLLIDHGWGFSLASSRPHYWYLSDLSYPLKLMAFTYPSVADSIFCFSPFWPPAAPDTQ